MPAQAKKAHVEQVLQLLGLTSSANTMVGDSLAGIKGISGGEWLTQLASSTLVACAAAPCCASHVLGVVLHTWYGSAHFLHTLDGANVQ